MEEKPKSTFIKKVKKTIYVLGGIMLFFVIVGSIGGDKSEKTVTEQSAPVVPEPTAAETLAAKEAAQKELTDLMELSKKSNLVASYEFSERANIVYVTDLWYLLEVTFKKDFLASIAMKKEIITGYHSFEVRNSKSNELVAEVTAFSGSLEVYK